MSAVYCSAKDCHGRLTIVEAESGRVWGGVCQKCGKHNERCQACGGYFVQMWRHLKAVPPWSEADNRGVSEPEDRRKARERAEACLAANPAFRAHRALKTMRAP
jgi:hypothetical protein